MQRARVCQARYLHGGRGGQRGEMKNPSLRLQTTGKLHQPGQSTATGKEATRAREVDSSGVREGWQEGRQAGNTSSTATHTHTHPPSTTVRGILASSPLRPAPPPRVTWGIYSRPGHAVDVLAGVGCEYYAMHSVRDCYEGGSGGEAETLAEVRLGECVGELGRERRPTR